MGGDKDASAVITMPNLLRTHVDDLHGHSSGTGKKGTHQAKLNFAVPGSTAKALHGKGYVTMMMTLASSDNDYGVPRA